MFRSFSLLMHKHATKWAEKYKIIPDYQNGFRAGYHTNNNPFILRCAIEEAKSKSKPLYVAVVDATNAFPSTDRATLWLKLNQLRMGGPLFDWLRMMYSHVEYYVKHGGNTTELFSALIGLLTGDTSSPILWNIFFGDLKMPEHKDDVWLAGLTVSILAQADDVLLISHSAVGMQLKLNVLTEWCSLNFITISKIKTVMMAFGRVPSASLASQWEAVCLSTL